MADNKVFLREGPGPQHGFKGATQRGWGPEFYGITLQQIKRLKEHPSINQDTTTMDLVNHVIKPLTKGCGIGYALLISQDQPLLAKVVVSVSPKIMTLWLSLSFETFY